GARRAEEELEAPAVQHAGVPGHEGGRGGQVDTHGVSLARAGRRFDRVRSALARPGERDVHLGEPPAGRGAHGGGGGPQAARAVRRLAVAVEEDELVRRRLGAVAVDAHQHVAVHVLGVLPVDVGPAQERGDLVEAAQLTAAGRAHHDVGVVDVGRVVVAAVVQQAGQAGEQVGDLQAVGDRVGGHGPPLLVTPILAPPTLAVSVGLANTNRVIRVDPIPERLAAKPSWLITQLAMHARRLVFDGFAATGARGYHYRILAALHEFGPASQAQLGRWCRIDRSDVVAA